MNRSEFWFDRWSEKALELADAPLHIVDGYQFLSEKEYSEMIRQVLVPLPLQDTKSLVEVGCGAGAFLQVIHQMAPDIQLTGVDICPEMVRLGSKRQAFITFHQAGAHDLSQFDDGCFDITTSFAMLCYLNHLEDAIQALDEMVRVTRPSGMIFLGDTSHADCLEASRQFLNQAWSPRKIPEYLYFNPEFFLEYAENRHLRARIVPMDTCVLPFYEPRLFRYSVYLER